MQTFLSVGFAPGAALTTWQLDQSGAFQTFTYWPTHTIEFSTEIFGAARFQPNQLDLSAVKDPQPFDYVLLCVPGLRDVARMVKKIERFVGKSTVVLVNIPEGAGMLQRLVKAAMPKAQVAAFICDFPVRHVPNTETNVWQVIQWGNTKSPGPHMAVHIEPVAPKLLAPLETSLTARRMPCSHAKNTAAFMAIQWERSIFTIGFELMTIIFNTPRVDKLVADSMALPIIEGVVTELLGLASAMGAKSLPSCTHFVQQAPQLTRKAPSIFAIPHASRMFYEFYSRAPISTDLLLLAHISLASDLRKIRTPYLECIYAFTTQLQGINNTPTDLFARVDLEAKQRLLDRDYEREHGNSNVARLEQQLQHALRQCEERERTLTQREGAIAEKHTALETLSQREGAVAEKHTALQTREAALQSREAALSHRDKEHANLEQRLAQLKSKEEQFAQREEALNERFRRLEARERDLTRQPPSRPMTRVNSSTQLATGVPNGQPPPTPQTPQQRQNGWEPTSPGTFMPHQRLRQSRLDTHAQLKRPGGPPGPPGPPGPQHGLGPQYAPGPHGLPGPPRRASAFPPTDQLDMMSLTNKNRRQSLQKHGHRSASMTSIASVAGPHSQTFQLDGIMNIASQDGYSAVGMKPKVHNSLSADHTVGASSRPFSHGPKSPPSVAKSPQKYRSEADFSNFGYSYDSGKQHLSHGSGSESISGSGNSRSTPPRSPSVTPPTPHMMEADFKEPFRIPGI